MVSSVPTSLNRLNFGVDLKEIGRSFVVTASFNYNILVDLPNKTNNIKPDPVVLCNEDSGDPASRDKGCPAIRNIRMAL